MPYVHIRTAGVLTHEQKAEIAKEFTESLERIAKKSKQYTYITFEEIPHDNWAIGGELLAKKD